MSLDHKLSLTEARRLALAGHGLNDGWSLADGREGTAQVIERLGYVQIDTIAVVERAHHHALWSRQSAYQPTMLDELLASDRRIFEYWHHAACYLPMRDYRFYLAQMRARGHSANTQSWLSENRDLADEVLTRIRDEGALRSSDFEAPPGHERGAWWSRKPAKVALEVLFSRGDLMISAREGFQRRYDLRERVLPDGLDLTEPTREEIGEHFARQNLRRMGLLQARDLTMPYAQRKDSAKALDRLLASGEAAQVQVEGLEGTPQVCLAAALDQAGAHEEDEVVHLLSPFDPLTIQRAWLLRLFGFDYKIECYVPAAKRIHGYFSLPVLWGQRFVGRIDAKADRQAGALLLRHVELEDPYELSEAFVDALAVSCWRYAAFNGCQEVVVERATPDLAAEPLRQALAVSGDSQP